MAENTDKQRAEQLKPFQFKKGQSGNPAGRPKGKTMKEYAREFLTSMTEDERIEFMNSLAPGEVWRMAEGNPAQETKLEGEIRIPLYLPTELIPNDISPSSEQNSEGQT